MTCSLSDVIAALDDFLVELLLCCGSKAGPLLASSRNIQIGLDHSRGLAPARFGIELDTFQNFAQQLHTGSEGGTARALHFLQELQRQNRRSPPSSGLLAACRHVMACCSGGKVLTFGMNEDGRLGLGDFMDRRRPEEVPWPDHAPQPVQSSCGGGHSALVDAQGGVWTCGITDGRLGRADEQTLAHMPTFRRVEPLWQANIKVRSVSCGWSYTLFLTETGSVYTTQQGTSTVAAGPLGKISGLECVIQISAGNEHALALSDTKRVYAWGSNEESQCLCMPLPSRTLFGASTSHLELPARVVVLNNMLRPAGDEVVGISAGGSHSLAWTQLGSLLTWGSNRWGQLGRYDSFGGLHLCVTTADPVKVASAGNLTTLFLTTEGQVYGMGRSQEGQLGENSTSREIKQPVLVVAQAAEGCKVVDVCAGRGCSFFVLEDGTLAACGCGYNGRLGTGTDLNTRFVISVCGVQLHMRETNQLGDESSFDD